MSRSKSKEMRKKKTSGVHPQSSAGPGRAVSGKGRALNLVLRQLESKVASLSLEEITAYLMRQSLAPTDLALCLSQLARICAQQNQVDKGAALVALGLESSPNDSRLLIAGGLIQAKAGNTQFAVDCYEAVLVQEPENTEALSNLADLLIKLNQWSSAVPFLVRLKGLLSGNSLVLQFLGTAYIKMNLFEEALTAFQRCLELEPGSLETLINIGVSLRQLRRYDEAEIIFQQALQCSPDHPELHNSLAWLYSDLLAFDKAVVHAEKACALQPTNINFLYCYGYLLRRFNRRDEARAVFKRALAVDPNDTAARFGYAELILAEGALQEGLACYESRFEVMQSWLAGPWPVWDGRQPAGKTIFVQHEQGVGDTIQFCRYLPLLHQAGARVVFSCQPSLIALVSRLKGIDALLAADSIDYSQLQADAQISLLSLMGVFATTMETIPAECPYLFADPALTARLGRQLVPTKKFKVGLIWAGNPKQAEDHNRSLHLSQLAPLAELTEDVQFYSLQMGYSKEQVKLCGNSLGLVDLSSHIGNFDDTAAFMANLDLIVSVCTSTIHLAGALGRPSVALLHSAADWRWFLDREDSPWYPTMRLIRQPAPRQWEPVLEELIRYIRGQLGK
jgi:tetratricopeptide (TPR) repeat protein